MNAYIGEFRVRREVLSANYDLIEKKLAE